MVGSSPQFDSKVCKTMNTQIVPSVQLVTFLFLAFMLLMVTVLLVTPQIRTEFRQLGQIEILCAWRCDS